VEPLWPSGDSYEGDAQCMKPCRSGPIIDVSGLRAAPLGLAAPLEPEIPTGEQVFSSLLETLTGGILGHSNRLQRNLPRHSQGDSQS
jgi:hypothetical protein